MCTVLIVDDHADTLDSLAEVIEAEGHAHHEATNGRDAMAWLENQAELPCVILLDLRMPRMDGWDFLRALRGVHRLANIPVVVISATIESDAPRPVLPAAAFWSKPPGAE